MNSNYRVENKGEVHMNGKRTTFSLFKKQGDAFVHVGCHTAPGWDQSDEKCVAAAMEAMDRLEQEGNRE